MKIAPSIAIAFVLVSAVLVAGQTPNSSEFKAPNRLLADTNQTSNSQDPALETAANTSTNLTPGLKQATTDNSEARDEDAVAEAQRSYDAGLALYTSGKYEEAIAALKEANRLRADDAQSHYLLGMAYMQSKSYKDAADAFRRAVRFKPDWAEANFRLGVMSYVLGRRTQSSEMYRKLLALNSPLASTLYRIIKADAGPAGVAESVVAESESAIINARTSAPKTPTNSSESNNGSTANTPPDSTKLPDALLTSIYRIGVGDVLDVRLLNSNINRSSLYTVLDGGVIDLPVAGGAISVAGLTADEVQAAIESELKRRAVEDHAQVSVGVRQYASHTVVVTGLVNSSGTKILRREAVPLYVVLAEVQPRLDAARVVVMRSGVTAQTLELNDSASLNFIIRPGDVINVISRPEEFYYIAGRINYPGQKNFQSGITVLQAILAAGGVANNGKTVEISREGEGGLLTTIKLNLKEIKAGKAEDMKLRAGDRIEVR